MIRLQMTSLQSQISTCLVVKSDATNKTVAKTNNGVYTNKICGVKTIEFTIYILRNSVRYFVFTYQSVLLRWLLRLLVFFLDLQFVELALQHVVLH